MPYLETPQEWLTQSTLLLKARPTTTRITTKYHLSPLPDPSSTSKKSRKANPTPNHTNPTTTTEEPTRATLILKTYDPVSGVALKYWTNKAAEVSRLIQILGRLARPMVGLEEVRGDDGVGVLGEVVGEGVSAQVVEGAGTAGAAAASATKGGGQSQGQGGGGGKKGKKRKK